ncbi:MAG TPA: fibronectin type III domain-containing protein [Vicinamibacteria bacterium]
MRRTAAAIALLVALPACGKRGDPLPPFRRTPPALPSFRVAQRGDQLEIRFTTPRASVDGARISDLSVETLRLDGDGDLEKQGRRNKRKVNPGEETVETAPLPAPGTVVRVSARAIVGKEPSPRSGPLVLRVQPKVAAPSDLTAQIVPEGIALVWQGEKPTPVAPPPVPSPSPSPGGLGPPAVAPTASPVPTPPPFPGGFWVYRRAASGAAGPPLTPQPTGERKLTDTGATLGGRWCYAVRAVAALEPLVESDPSNEACVDSKDIFPPAPPAGLAALGRDEGVELTWSPSPEGDLAGYRVWRAAPGGTPERIVELPAGERQYMDASALRGTAYRYTVTAFDQAGNESARSAPAEGARP